ncbi:A/G-specific adenine glycosylase [Shouchella clausii]|uniref:A/G-specific adenine glycosylase n=1 Tax=Shouchella clausii TaxID=79880 RepID=UPI00280AEEBF|nr:A/G-specific adenine glycosylase [Shouchella clausii]WMM32478.1 A/G-specific adenine glycosylase [Shouchella clausii]
MENKRIFIMKAFGFQVKSKGYQVRRVTETYNENISYSDFRRQLIEWYQAHKRELPWRESSDPYHIWVSEIMLQQTRVDTVIPYYEQFMRKFPEMEDLAYAEEEEILKVWEGLGYYSRVRNLQAAVREVVEHYGSVVPDTRKEIEQLKGVGPYTAGAILSIAYAKAEPAVDGNVMRVLSRVFCMEDDIGKPQTRKKHEAILYELIDKSDPSSFNQGLMELGALVCTPTSPGCLLCPVRTQCLAYERGQQERLPIKMKKKKAKSIELESFLLKTEKGELLIEKRPDKGLLAGLWQLPVLEGRFDPGERQQKLAEKYHIEAEPSAANFQVKHIFSHLIWEIELYVGRANRNGELPANCRIIKAEELEQYAFPVSQQKLLNHCLEEGWL